MTTKTVVERKAEHLIVLYLLEQEGLLTGLTQQNIADLFGYGHRSTGLRLLRSLRKLKIKYESYREYVLMLHEERRRRCKNFKV